MTTLAPLLSSGLDNRTKPQGNREVMEKSSANAGGASDVVLARNLIIDIAGNCWNGKQDMLDRVFDATARHARRHQRKPLFTRRRLRAFWHLEAALVRFCEIVELNAVADAERKAHESTIAARRDHAQFVASIASTIAALDACDADFHRAHIQALRGLAGEPAVHSRGNAAGARAGDAVCSAPDGGTHCAGVAQ